VLEGLLPCELELLDGLVELLGLLLLELDESCEVLEAPDSVPAAPPNPGASRSGQLFWANPGADSIWLFCMSNMRYFWPG